MQREADGYDFYSDGMIRIQTFTLESAGIERFNDNLQDCMVLFIHVIGRNIIIILGTFKLVKVKSRKKILIPNLKC